MYRIIFKLCIVFSIAQSLSVQTNYRKYNVDQESHKLYGEDFKSVLKRFRRTPDYLKILQDKLGDLKTSAKEMSLQVLHYYHGKLEERVNEVLPTTTTVAGSPARIEKDEPKEQLHFHAHDNRRQEDPAAEHFEESMLKIQNLDNYKVFDSQLTVAERNNLRDVGFEYAGKIIHSIIENMSPLPASGTTTEKFTQLPKGGQSEEKEGDTTTTTPTTHPSEHAVRHGTHKEDGEDTVQDESSPSTEPYDFRAPSKRHQIRKSFFP